MGVRYDVEATGLSGVPYRVELDEAGFSGSTTTVRGGRQFVVIEGRQSTQGNGALFPKDLRLFVRDDADLTPLFGQKDTAITARVIRTDTGSQIFRGYLLNDLYNDDPLSGQPLVELGAIDGLSLLKNRAKSDLSETGVSLIRSIFEDILQGVHDIEVEFATDLRPYLEDGNQLDADDMALRYTQLDLGIYDGATQFEILDDLASAFGLTVRQRARDGDALAWHVRDAASIASDGSLKVWVYDSNGFPKTGYPQSVDLSQAISDVEADHTREFQRRRQSVTQVYDHPEVAGLIRNGGFETGDSGAWTLNSGSNWTSAVNDHDNINATQDATSDNQFLVEGAFEVFSGRSTGPVWFAEQTFPALQEEVTPTPASISFDHGIDETEPNADTDEKPQQIEVRVGKAGSYYLRSDQATVQASALQGEGKVYIDALNGPIPEGAELAVKGSGGTTLTLSQAADTGDEVLVGDLGADVSAGDKVGYVYFDDSAPYIVDLDVLYAGPRSEEYYKPFQLDFYWSDQQKDPIFGEVRIRLGMQLRDYGVSPGTGQWFINTYFDEFSLDLPIKSTRSVASVVEAGEAESRSVLIGDGPTSTNKARLRGVFNGNTYEAISDWKRGTYASGESRSGLRLGEIVSQSRLRYVRNHREILKVTAVPRSGSPITSGDELVRFDGTGYLIQGQEYEPYSGRLRLDLLEWSDLGLSGISTTSRHEIETTGTRAGGAGTSGATIIQTGGTSFTVDGVTIEAPNDTLQVVGGGIDTPQLAGDAVTQPKIAADAVGSPQIATGAVGGEEIETASVGSSEIAADAVTTAKIEDDAVVTSRIAPDAVTGTRIAADAVGNAQIANDAVGSPQIADNAVGSAQIGSGAVGATQIATGAVGATEIADGAVGSDQVSAALVGNGLKGGGGTVIRIEPTDFAGTGLIDEGTDNLAIGDQGVTSVKIANGAVTDAKIASSVAGDGLQGAAGSPLAVDSTVARTDRDQNLNGVTWTWNINPDQIQFTSDAANRNFIRIDEGGTVKWDIRYRGDLGAEAVEFYDSVGSNSVLLLDRTNNRIGVGGITSPSADLHTNGLRADGQVDFSNASQFILPSV